MIFILEMFDKTNIKYTLCYYGYEHDDSSGYINGYGNDYKLNWRNDPFLTIDFDQLRIILRSE